MQGQLSKKVLIASDFDSRIAWSMGFASLFHEKEYQVDLILSGQSTIEIQRCSYIQSELRFKTLRDLIVTLMEGQYDVFVIALGGGQHIKLIKMLDNFVRENSSSFRPLVITGFNGIEDITDPHGLYCRSGSDYICVNSPKVFQANIEFLKQMGVGSEVLYLTGYIRDYWNIKSEPSKEIKKILFVLQPGLLDHPKQLEYMGGKIIEYCTRYPDRTFYIKPRGPKVGLHVNSDVEKKYFKAFWEGLVKRGPANLKVSYSDISDLIVESDLIISFTSAALIEALILNKKVIAISDFGISRAIGNVYLLESGLLCSFDCLLKDMLPAVSKTWFSENIFYSKNAVLNLIDRINEQLSIQLASKKCLPFKPMVYSEVYQPYLFRTLVKRKNVWSRALNFLIKKIRSN